MILHFKLPKPYVPTELFCGQRLNEREDRELTYLILSGSSGLEENGAYHSMAKNIGKDDSTQSKRRYLFSRVIVNDDYLEKHYPVVRRHKALYPLLLVYRPVKGLLTHPKGILHEYRRIRDFRTDDETAYNYDTPDRGKDEA